MPHVMAAKAVALAEARQPEFAGYARRIVENAAALADGLMRRGARLVTGGTENHLVVLDVESSFGLTGRQAESALVESGVVTNRNSIPADPNGAWYTSGVRLGTPALTTLGLGTDELDEVAAIIVDVLSATTPASTKSGTSKARYQLRRRRRRREPQTLRRPPRQIPPLPDDRSLDLGVSYGVLCLYDNAELSGGGRRRPARPGVGGPAWCRPLGVAARGVEALPPPPGE